MQSSSSLIIIHAYFGFVTLILDFPISKNKHDNYINDIKKYIFDLESSGYSIVLSGIGIDINENFQRKNINLNQIVEVITEDEKGLKFKSTFEIDDVYYRRIKKKRLIGRLNSRDYSGNFKGLMNVTPKNMV